MELSSFGKRKSRDESGRLVRELSVGMVFRNAPGLAAQRVNAIAFAKSVICSVAPGCPVFEKWSVLSLEGQKWACC